MKTNISFNRIPVLILLVLLTLFNTCNKNDDEPPGNYRIVQWNKYLDDAIWGQALFEYEENRIIFINGFSYFSEGDSNKTEIGYPDENSIVRTDYEKDGGTWQQTGRFDMVLQDENITEVREYDYFNGAWDPSDRNTYQYQNGNLTEDIQYYYELGDWKPEDKIAYEYNGSKVVLINEYNYSEGWELTDKGEVIYMGDKKDSIVFYSYADGTFYEEHKYIYAYTNNLISRIDFYTYEAGVWLPDDYYVFTYDSHGNVQTMSAHEAHRTFKYEYIYEEGKGNLSQIQLSIGNDMLIPMPAKSSLAPGDKSKYLFTKIKQ